MMKNLIATAAIAAALSAAGAASASTIFYLTVNGCSSTCVPGGAAIGEVEVSGLGTNVLNFDVDLYGTATFNNAGLNGSHQAFGFNLTGDPSVTITNIVSSVPMIAVTTGDSTASPFGDFDNVLQRSPRTGKQGQGGSTLDFTVTGAPGAHLTFDSHEASGGVILEADVFSNGNTGSVGALGGGAVPEPAAWTMMLVGFGALGGLVRRRRATLAKVSVS